MIPVLVADDHGFIRAGVEAVLRGSRFSIVAGTASGEETLDAIETHDPAIVLLDINMPGMDGVQALETLRERGDKRSVVLLTAEINNQQLMSCMRAGVDGIISKDGAEDDLVNVLEVVHSGERAISPKFLQRALDLASGIKGVREIRPLVGASSPVINLKRELLPAPFCPISVIRLPVRTEKLTSSSNNRTWSYSKLTSENLKITESLGI